MVARFLTAMMKRKVHRNDETPPVFADLLFTMPDGQMFRVGVEKPGWLKDFEPLLDTITRVGLVLRNKNEPSVWLDVNGDQPRYLSRVLGNIDDRGDRQVRVAGLICGDTSVWLHRDGLVEVGLEPTFR